MQEASAEPFNHAVEAAPDTITPDGALLAVEHLLKSARRLVRRVDLQSGELEDMLSLALICAEREREDLRIAIPAD